MKNEYLNKKFTVKINNGGDVYDHNNSVFGITHKNNLLMKNALEEFTKKMFFPNWVVYAKFGGVDGIIDSLQLVDNCIILDFKYYYIPEISSFYSQLKKTGVDGQWFLGCEYKFKDINPPIRNTSEYISPSDELEYIKFKSLYYIDWERRVKNTVISV